MPLVHSTNQENLDEIRRQGLLLARATYIEGMQSRAIWLFDSEDKRAKNVYHKASNVLLEVNRDKIEDRLLHAYFSIDEQFTRTDPRPDSYKYLGNIKPEYLRIFGDTSWGIPGPTIWKRAISAINKIVGRG